MERKPTSKCSHRKCTQSGSPLSGHYHGRGRGRGRSSCKGYGSWRKVLVEKAGQTELGVSVRLLIRENSTRKEAVTSTSDRLDFFRKGASRAACLGTWFTVRLYLSRRRGKCTGRVDSKAVPAARSQGCVRGQLVASVSGSLTCPHCKWKVPVKKMLFQ